ncbi:DUF4350 domain-containing protein [Micromonospora sp. 15K316]|uniref:DUF4350 domain-containing protein n=1 Tax=Micromonospora sp. 15K316 TaxID=2530376 RepID=UPI001A9EDEAE|nr:DUF4350 domain-containing protein [Micromonospora sp. 15K316]
MTAAAQTANPAGPRPAAAPPRPTAKRRRRWHRLVIPLGLVAALITTTLVAQTLDRPDPDDPGYLSPLEIGDHGGSRLAEALRRRGAGVARETDSRAALLAARTGPPATLFVPAPDLLRSETLSRLTRLPVGTRVVLVDPSVRALHAAGVPVDHHGRRWATKVVGPQAGDRPCPLDELRPVRHAAAQRQRYAPDAEAPVQLCFSAGLARVPGAVDTVLVGADDPFRNDRIAEHDNEALATALLGVHPRVVWLDLDGPEPPPPTRSSTPPDAASPTERPRAETVPPGGTAQGRPGSPGDGSGNRGPADPDDGPAPNPLWSAFPLWFWAMLVQLALALLLAALWRARRLGPPAPEPLPVAVRSAETALGRARLYQRAGARGPAGRTLRSATLARLLPWLNLTADTPQDQVATAVAARAGGEPEQVEELLYGDDPATDEELLDLARSLDAVTRAVTATPPGPTRGVTPTGTEPTEGGPR